MISRQISPALLFVSLVLLHPAEVIGQRNVIVKHWNQWRGPTRDGQVAGKKWPVGVSGDRIKELWRKDLGPSYSGPVVNKKYVFTTATVDRSHEVVYAFDRKTGKQIWATKWKGAMSVPFFAARNGSWIRATPCLDGKRLFVAGMRDVLVCLDADSGNELWKVDFVKKLRTSLPAFGFVSSPMVDGEFVYVQAGGSFVKLNKKTGAIIWRTLKDGGGTFGSAFSSPTLATIQGKRMLLVQTRAKLTGVDIESGEVLWSQTVPSFRGMNILTPTIHDNNVFTSSYGGKSFLFNLRKNEDKYALSTAWTNKAQAYMSSPVVIGDHAYIHLRNRLLTCINLNTGKTAWTASKRFGQYMSMIAQDDRILALDQTGTLYLFRANPEKYELLDGIRISKSEAWAHLAVDGDQLFIRELNALAAYRWNNKSN